MSASSESWEYPSIASADKDYEGSGAQANEGNNNDEKKFDDNLIIDIIQNIRGNEPAAKKLKQLKPLSLTEKLQIKYRNFEVRNGKKEVKYFYTKLFFNLVGFGIGGFFLPKIAQYIDDIK